MIPFLAIIGIGQAYNSKDYNMWSIFKRDTLKDLFIAAISIAMQ